MTIIYQPSRRRVPLMPGTTREQALMQAEINRRSDEIYYLITED